MLFFQILIELIGWAGALGVIYAYFQLTSGKIQPTSFSYQFINIISALCLVLNGTYYGAIPSVAVNLVWMAIGMYAITNLSMVPSHARPTSRRKPRGKF